MERLRKLYASPTFWTFGIGPLAAGYGVLLYVLGQLRTEHALILGAWLVLVYVPRFRDLIRGLLPFFLFALLYDSLRFVTPVVHARVPIHVVGPYRLEQWLFGWHTDSGAVLIPSQLLGAIDHPLVLALAGFAYFFFIYEVFLFGIYLFAKDRALLTRFGWTFLLVCTIGFVTYYVYPAAPPWYVAEYGLGPAIIGVPGDPARLAEVDALLGVRYFTGFYARTTNVYGALPSLHVAYPLLVWLYVRRSDLARWHWPFLAFFLLMCFAAVFLDHHYVIDVILGVIYALAVYMVMEGVLWRRVPAAREGVRVRQTLDQRV